MMYPAQSTLAILTAAAAANEAPDMRGRLTHEEWQALNTPHFMEQLAKATQGRGGEA